MSSIVLDKKVLAHKNLDYIEFMGGNMLTLWKTDYKAIDVCLVERTGFRQKLTGGMVSSEIIAYQISYRSSLYLVDPTKISQHLISILENPANEIPAIEKLAIEKRKSERMEYYTPSELWDGRDKAPGTYVDSEE